MSGQELRRGAIILAGGDSKRLGSPKPLLPLNGLTLIERVVERLGAVFNEITVVTDKPDLFRGLPVRITGDLLESHPKNPLRGIHAGLSLSDLPFQFVAACDMPFINLDLVCYMAGFAPRYDIVVPCIGRYYQPLHAFYRRTCLEPIERQLEKGGGKVTGFYRHLNVRRIGASEIRRFDPLERSFFNINTWEDYTAAREMLACSRKGGKGPT